MMFVFKIFSIFGVNFFVFKFKVILYFSFGFFKFGEMCFVLGWFEVGCIIFLKIIINQRVGFMEIKGNVEYVGVGWKEMCKCYGGQVNDFFFVWGDIVDLNLIVKLCIIKKMMIIFLFLWLFRLFDLFLL